MTTFVLFGEIRFPAHKGRQAFKVRQFSECKIESSWQSLTDTAEIVLPRKVRDFDRRKVSEWFREGDPIEIWLGYDGEIKLEFAGYVSKVPAGIPLVIRAEDEMYMLKRRTASVSKQNCTLRDLLEAIAPGYTVSCDETKLLGSVRYANMQVSQILDDLKKAGINSWFEGNVLHALSDSNRVDVVDIVLEQTAGESLKQKAVENVMVVISLLRKIGKKLKVEFGDKGAGVRINREISGITMTEAEMLAEAKTIYNRAKTPGMDGDVTLFGTPRVQHGTPLRLRSTMYPEKDGTYRIDAVTKTFSPQGYMQQCKLGAKI